jgi:ABC-2 type transport system permease protein
MWPLYKKELSFYLNNPIGYIVVALFAIFSNFLFTKDLFVYGSASLRPFFDILPWLMMVFVPALSMRVLSEEKRTNTLEVLLSLPISETQIVLSKFLALLTLLAIGVVLTLSLPISLYLLTTATNARIYLPEVIIGYFGELLVGASFIAISLFFSSQTKNQVVAFLLSVLTLFFLIIFSTEFVAGVLPHVVQNWLYTISPVSQVEPFVKGVIDVRSLFYFLSFTAVWLLVTIIDLEKRS